MIQETDRKGIFAERLRKACIAQYGKEHGIASRLSEDADVSIQTASKWLRGSVMPEAHRWGVIASKLGVSASWLVGSTHEEPEHLKGRFDDESLETASEAARIVFPLVTRLKPDASQELVDELFRHAYQQLKAGYTVRSVSGEVASRLI